MYDESFKNVQISFKASGELIRLSQSWKHWDGHCWEFLKLKANIRRLVLLCSPSLYFQQDGSWKERQFISVVINKNRHRKCTNRKKVLRGNQEYFFYAIFLAKVVNPSLVSKVNMLFTNRLALLESSLSPYCYQCYYLAYHLCQLMWTYVRDDTHSKEAIDAKEIVLVDF